MDREALGSIREKTPYDIQIVVDNVLYNWTDVLANVENEQGRDVCHLVVKTNTCHCKQKKISENADRKFLYDHEKRYG